MARKYFNSRVFKLKVYFLVLLFAVDIILNSFTQFLGFGNDSAIEYYQLTNVADETSKMSIILFVVQLVIQFTMLFTSLSLFFSTFHFQLGIVSTICRDFKWTFLSLALYPIFFIFERVYKLFYLNDDDKIEKNVVTIWADGGYMVIYVLKYITGFAYYIFVLDAAYELGKAKYYRPDDEALLKELSK